MNRIIIFRAWNKNLKEMWDCDHLILNGIYLGTARGTFVDVINNRIPMQELIPLLFTGAVDKNGKEIYEGDIVKRKGRLPEEIFFEDCAFLIGKKNSSDSFFCQSIGNDCEIIGNIYQNPELLK
jgi:uncharacterized phage protein (TIGR01671 family)